MWAVFHPKERDSRMLLFVIHCTFFSPNKVKVQKYHPEFRAQKMCPRIIEFTLTEKMF